MGHTKGKLTQGKSNTLLYINGINFGDILVGGLPHEECEANAKEITRRWNAFEDSRLAPVSDLLTLGLLQEKNKVAALEKKVKAQKAYIEELEQAI